MEIETFHVTENHLRLMRRFNIEYRDGPEFGAPAVDPKRPYGNGNVYEGMAKILEIPCGEDGPDLSEAQRREMRWLHKETATALRIALVTGEFKAGFYQSPKYKNEWTLVG